MGSVTTIMASEQEEQEGGVFDSLAEEMDKAAEAHPHDIDKQIEMALECPCVGTIRSNVTALHDERKQPS